MKHFMQIMQQMASLFSYPDAQYKERVFTMSELLPDREKTLFQPFVQFCQETPLPTIEEWFTRTFDMNPATCLEIGWHLFGEDYKRGEFLVHMRQTLAEFQIEESVELPDHLSHCLRLLLALDDEEARIYTQKFLLKPLERIRQNLEKTNPFYHAVRVLLLSLSGHFKVLPPVLEQKAQPAMFKEN